MNTDKYILQEVTTSAQEREWLDLPKKIYKGNRNWVCPLDQDITEVFDPARNELFADGEAVRWVVRNKAGEVVGRIAAFYNREKAAIEEQPTGGCGFFEAIDDQQVADMMFDASRMWLASRGMEAMDGPINFGQRRDWCPQQDRVCEATNAPVGISSGRTVCVSRWRGFAPTSSEKRLLRAINKQRQGITMEVVPCLLLCIPYIARFGSIAAYVRTWPVRTYAGKRAGSCI